jgi:2-keto-4-pentenoate hydratase
MTARTIVEARRAAQALAEFPGPLPETLAQAYAIQAEAVALWPDHITGWKVGRITGDDAVRFGKDRFIGPIFSQTIRDADEEAADAFPVIAGGSAALEAEVVAVLDRRVEPMSVERSPEDIRALIGDLRIGIEVAGCPIREVGDLGPLASIAAFGNNMALILGPAIAGWRDRDLDAIACRSMIDGVEVGSAVAGKLPGGILTAMAFALDQAAELGIDLPAGTLLSTGAITGVHPVSIGQACEADFGDFGLLHCLTSQAHPGKE